MNHSAARPTRLSRRDVDADRVWRAMIANAEHIASVRDVLTLPCLSSMNGERIAVAVADNAGMGRVVGGSGAGRIRAIEEPER